MNSGIHAAAPSGESLDLSRFPRRADAISWLVVLAHLAFVFAPVYLAVVLGPSPWLIVLWLWFGAFMHGLINLMHECAHLSTFRARASSNWLGRWLLGPLVFADFDSYRRRHWDHHRHFGVAGDAKDAYLIELRDGGLWRLLRSSLLLAEAMKKLRVQQNTIAAPGTWLLRTAIVQGVFALSLVALAWWMHLGSPTRALFAALLAYGFVYAHGLAALTTFVATLRAIAEHQQGPGDALRVGRAALRNFSCGPLGRLLFGAYGFAEHATHHREPAVPSYHLRAATALLAVDPAFAPQGGYFERLRVLAGAGSRNA